MRFHAFLFLAAALSSFAQIPGTGTASPSAQMPAGPTAPPEVDKALRARLNAFLDYQSKGDFRKAYDLVAEDSKDFYFSAPKAKSGAFTIDEVHYGPDLSTASVRSTVKRQMMLAGHPVDVPQLTVSEWKLEKGEWFWYHDPSKDVTKTIFGDVPVAPADATTEPSLPKDVSQKAALAAAANILAAKATLDKKLVTFTFGKEATEQVIFHNSNPGQVHVYAEVRGVADTVTIEPNDRLVDPQAEVQYKITYKPHPESPVRGRLLFTLEPFGSVYVLPVRLLRENQIPKPITPSVP